MNAILTGSQTNLMYMNIIKKRCESKCQLIVIKNEGKWFKNIYSIFMKNLNEIEIHQRVKVFKEMDTFSKKNSVGEIDFGVVYLWPRI